MRNDSGCSVDERAFPIGLGTETTESRADTASFVLEFLLPNLRLCLAGLESAGSPLPSLWESICFVRLARFRARLRAAAPRQSSSQYRADAFFPDGKGSPQTAHFMLAV